MRAYCRKVAREKKREFAHDDYWGKPVPSLGPASAELLIVGLAPAAHGGNRTGRMFTGDSSGAWLARALHKFGFATAPHSLHRDDGFVLVNAFITAALRCAPPQNRPTPAELNKCAVHMRAELEALADIRVVVGLGKIGFDAAAARLREIGYEATIQRPRFSHGAEYRLEHAGGRRPVTLLGSFHPSRQNTNTGKLTRAMLDAVFARAAGLIQNR